MLREHFHDLPENYEFCKVAGNRKVIPLQLAVLSPSKIKASNVLGRSALYIRPLVGNILPLILQSDSYTFSCSYQCLKYVLWLLGYFRPNNFRCPWSIISTSFIKPSYIPRAHHTSASSPSGPTTAQNVHFIFTLYVRKCTTCTTGWVFLCIFMCKCFRHCLLNIYS